jgi:hypothetical protein
MPESPPDMLTTTPRKRTPSLLRRIVFPIIGGAIVAALTALLFWMIERYLL